jgi:hypothetical protein
MPEDTGSDFHPVGALKRTSPVVERTVCGWLGEDCSEPQPKLIRAVAITATA